MLVSNADGLGAVPAYGAKTSASAVGLAWTTEFGSYALTDITNISFYSNHALTTDALRIAVRLDNNTPGNTADDFWVATDAGFIRNSATAGTVMNFVANGELESFTFTLAAASWRDLTFVPAQSGSIRRRRNRQPSWRGGGGAGISSGMNSSLSYSKFTVLARGS